MGDMADDMFWDELEERGREAEERERLGLPVFDYDDSDLDDFVSSEDDDEAEGPFVIRLLCSREIWEQELGPDDDYLELMKRSERVRYLRVDEFATWGCVPVESLDEASTWPSSRLASYWLQKSQTEHEIPRITLIEDELSLEVMEEPEQDRVQGHVSVVPLSSEKNPPPWA